MSSCSWSVVAVSAGLCLDLERSRMSARVKKLLTESVGWTPHAGTAPGLPLGTEDPVMMPSGIDFFHLFLRFFHAGSDDMLQQANNSNTRT